MNTECTECILAASSVPSVPSVPAVPSVPSVPVFLMDSKENFFPSFENFDGKELPK